MFFKFTELMVNLPAEAEMVEKEAGTTGCGCSWTVTIDPQSLCTWVTEEATGSYARQAQGGMLALLREQLQHAVAAPA